MTRRTTRTAPRPGATPVRGGERAWLAVGLLVLGVGAASVALLGPLVGGVIDYHNSEGAINQIIGGDVAGLLLVAPSSILAAALVWKRHPAGPVLALPPALYALYMYLQLALGGEVLRYTGNSERFFPLFLGLFVLAGAIVHAAWREIDTSDLPATPRWMRRTAGVFFLVVAFFLTVGLHLPGLVDAWTDQPGSIEYLADPVAFWLVKFMDLAIVVPVLVLTGVGVLRGSAWATKVGYAVVGWVALLGATVAGMAIVMQATDDPEATVANTVVFSVFAAIALWLAVAYYHPLFRIRTSGSVGDEGSHTAGDRSDPVSTPAVAEAEPPVSRSSTESVSS